MRAYIWPLILLLAATHSLVGCSAASKKSQGLAMPADAPDIPLCDCRPYPRPGPINIGPIQPINTGPDGWQLDNQSYLNNAEVWLQFERYMRETESALNYWHSCVAACNRQYIEINDKK